MSSHQAGHPGLDLAGSLADLAGSVHDEALTARLTRQVGPMVTRVRRRRAARATAAGAVAVGTVASVAVAAVALTGGGTGEPGPLPPATAAPTEQGAVGAADLTCGAQVAEEDLRPTAGGLELSAPELRSRDVIAGDPLDVTVVLTNSAAAGLERVSPGPGVALAALREGVVVATGAMPLAEGSLAVGTGIGADQPVDLALCGGADDDDLEPGVYALVAAADVPVPDGAEIRLSAGPVLFTVLPAEDAGTPEQRDALAAILAEAGSQAGERAFPACGSLVPKVAADTPLTLDIDLDDGTGTSVPAGAEIQAVTVLWPNGPRVIANVPETGPTVVLARDGVVVARAANEPGDARLLETAADDPRVFYAAGLASLCALGDGDAPVLALPPGRYTAYAVLEAALKEVDRPDGTTESRSDTVVVVSDPAALTVTAGDL